MNEMGKSNVQSPRNYKMPMNGTFRQSWNRCLLVVDRLLSSPLLPHGKKQGESPASEIGRETGAVV
jgi:hypothetical protein